VYVPAGSYGAHTWAAQTLTVGAGGNCAWVADDDPFVYDTSSMANLQIICEDATWKIQAGIGTGGSMVTLHTLDAQACPAGTYTDGATVSETDITDGPCCEDDCPSCAESYDIEIPAGSYDLPCELFPMPPFDYWHYHWEWEAQTITVTLIASPPTCYWLSAQVFIVTETKTPYGADSTCTTPTGDPVVTEMESLVYLLKLDEPAPCFWVIYLDVGQIFTSHYTMAAYRGPGACPPGIYWDDAGGRYVVSPTP
jgi:hypothetical protein